MVVRSALPRSAVAPELDCRRARAAATDLQDALFQESSRAEAAEFLRQLVDEITLTPGNGELRIEFRGELAGILRLTSRSKKPVSDRDGLEQIKLVAGRGFEPLTFRL